jgi:hypothetical protein
VWHLQGLARITFGEQQDAAAPRIAKRPSRSPSIRKESTAPLRCPWGWTSRGWRTWQGLGSQSKRVAQLLCQRSWSLHARKLCIHNLPVASPHVKLRRDMMLHIHTP